MLRLLSILLTITGVACAQAFDQRMRTLTLSPRGTGAGQTGQVCFEELRANGTNTACLKAPDSLTANIGWSLPSSDGTNGQVLTTNGAGVLSWSAGGGGGGTTITVNGSALAATSADLDDSTPAGPTNKYNVKWQKDALTPTNISAYVDPALFVSPTWGAGATLTWTFDAGAIDPILTFTSNAMSLSTMFMAGSSGAPTRRLHVTGAAGDTYQMRVEANSANEPAVEMFSGATRRATLAAGATVVSLYNDDESAANAIHIHQTSGNVGVGVTAPDEKLEVAGSVLQPNNTYIFNKDSGGTKRAVLGTGTDNDVNVGMQSAAATGGDLVLWARGTAYLELDEGATNIFRPVADFGVQLGSTSTSRRFGPYHGGQVSLSVNGPSEALVAIEAVAGGGFVSVRGPTSMASTWNFRLPSAAPGATDRFFKSGSGTDNQAEWFNLFGTANTWTGGQTFTATNSVDLGIQSSAHGKARVFTASLCNGAACSPATATGTTKSSSTVQHASVEFSALNIASDFYTRVFSGADVNCANVSDGWLGVRTDTNELQVCIGGVVKKVALA